MAKEKVKQTKKKSAGTHPVQRFVSTIFSHELQSNKCHQHIVGLRTSDGEQVELVLRKDKSKYLLCFGKRSIYLDQGQFLMIYDAFDNMLSKNLYSYIKTTAFRTTRRFFKRIIASR